MVNGWKVATVWGVAALLVLAATACDTERAGEATGPALMPRTAAGRPPQPRAGTEAGAPAPGNGASGIAGRDAATSPLYYRDSDGYLYEVRFVVDGAGQIERVEHLRDGVLFASTAPESGSGSENIQVYDGGQLILDDNVLLAGASAAASVSMLPVRRPGVGGPRRMLAYDDCGAEWTGYASASAYLIAAGAWYSLTHSSKALNNLRFAVTGFITAWTALVECRLGGG